MALAVNSTASRAIRAADPSAHSENIKTGILSLVWLHVGVVAGVRGLEPAVYVAILWLPAYILGRWLYST